MKTGLGGADVQAVLDDLAKVSGYRELSQAPLMFLGHSAGGPQPRDKTVKLADRCFALLQHHGGGPWDGTEPVPPGIPTLTMVGQFDEFSGGMRDEAGNEAWQRSRDALIAHRQKNEAFLSSLTVEPGAGHFAWSDRSAAHVALFIRKAAQARIPASWPIDSAKPPQLLTVDPKSGWLSDLTLKTAGEFPSAPYNEYRGDKAKANWHLDKELALASVAYEAGMTRKDQFIKWSEPHRVKAGARFFLERVKWVGDGQTLEVSPVYADVYPGQYDGLGPRWFLAGKPVGHSNAPIFVKTVSGPLVPTAPNRFRMQFDNLAPITEASRITFLSYSAGDNEYRYTEHVGILPRSFTGTLKEGKDQTITFPPLANLKANSGPVELKATSDFGLPVEYYVQH